MRFFYVLLFGLVTMGGVRAEEKSDSFEKIVTRKGLVYLNCKVTRVEADALTFQHSEGVARVSFFDLSEEIQNQYEFDPIAGMKKYKNDLETRRDQKWERFWAAQKKLSEQAEQDERDVLISEAKRSWLPVEAHVSRKGEKGAYVMANRIVFQPTTVKSTLGFDRPGPPRKTLVRIQPGIIFIETPTVTGGKWLGYLEPRPVRLIDHPSKAGETVPVYRAMAREELQ